MKPLQAKAAKGVGLPSTEGRYGLGSTVLQHRGNRPQNAEPPRSGEKQEEASQQNR
jgi:hypothetical protein